MRRGWGWWRGCAWEAGYRFRNFHGVEWTPTDDADALPAEWPRSLDFSGPLLSIGWQLLDKVDGREGQRWTVERLAGRLYLTWRGHVLAFAPGNAPAD